MPELPEVETIKNALLLRIKGCTITGIELIRDKSVHKPTPKQFCEQLLKQRIEDIRRRGKYFLFDLSGGEILGIHLKMTGVLLLENKIKLQKHSIAIFRMENRFSLHFVDQRKFGSLWLVDDENEIVGNLGPEPLGQGFTTEILGNTLRRHTIPIKALICDQNAIAGIGNMYADEALYEASIHPLTPSNRLNKNQVTTLHKSIIKVLEKGIAHNGASIRHYQLPDGAQGMAHTQFRVAHRIGKNCPVCGTPVNRICIRGRGSYFCPVCQPE